MDLELDSVLNAEVNQMELLWLRRSVSLRTPNVSNMLHGPLLLPKGLTCSDP